MSGTLAISWAEFEKIANFEYDNGFGAQEIASDLVVVGENWWLERSEYDGSECWAYMKKPVREDNYSSFSVLKGTGWKNLQDSQGISTND